MRAPSERVDTTRVATCAQCRSLSSLRWTGWRAIRIDEPDEDEAPALAFFCPTCAEREFGYRTR